METRDELLRMTAFEQFEADSAFPIDKVLLAYGRSFRLEDTIIEPVQIWYANGYPNFRKLKEMPVHATIFMYNRGETAFYVKQKDGRWLKYSPRKWPQIILALSVAVGIIWLLGWLFT